MFIEIQDCGISNILNEMLRMLRYHVTFEINHGATLLCMNINVCVHVHTHTHTRFALSDRTYT